MKLYPKAVVRHATIEFLASCLRSKIEPPPLNVLVRALMKPGRFRDRAEIMDWIPSELVSERHAEEYLTEGLEVYTGPEVHTPLYRTFRFDETSEIASSLPQFTCRPLAAYISTLRYFSTEAAHRIQSLSEKYGMGCAPLPTVLKWAKHISTVYKKFALSEIWSWYVDIVQALGYVQDLDSQKEDVVTQVNSFFRDNQRTLHPLFKHTVQKVAKEIISRIRPQRQPTEWLQSFSWTTEGSLPIKQDIIDARLQKRALPLVKDTEEVLNDIFKVEPYSSSILLKKDEPSKIRLIISSDYREFMLGAYLFDGCSFNLPITVGWTQEQSNVVFNEMQERLRSGSFIIPLDYSSFDHQVLKGEVMLAMQAIMEAIQAPADLSTTYLSNLEHSVVKINPELASIIGSSEPRSWSNGLLSGSYFTALLGSLVNQTWLRLAGGEGLSQGDDAAAYCASWQEGFRLVRRLQAELNLDINVKKFYVSRERTEYLRWVISTKRIYQYPSRPINGILYTKPAAASDIGEVSRARSWVSSVQEVITRSGSKLDRDTWLRLSDNWHQSRRQLVRRLFNLPYFLGGFGTDEIKERYSVPVDSDDPPPALYEPKESWIPLDPGFTQGWKGYISSFASEGVIDPENRSKRRAASKYTSYEYIDSGKQVKRSGSFLDLFGAVSKLNRPLDVYKHQFPGLSLSQLLRRVAREEPALAGIGRLINRTSAIFAKEYIEGNSKAPIPLSLNKDNYRSYQEIMSATLYPAYRDRAFVSRELLLSSLAAAGAAA